MSMCHEDLQMIRKCQTGRVHLTPSGLRCVFIPMDPNNMHYHQSSDYKEKKGDVYTTIFCSECFGYLSIKAFLVC